MKAALSWIAIAILAGGAGVSSWLLFQEQHPHYVAKTSVRPRNAVDYSMQDSRITRYGLSGHRLYVLVSPHVKHMRDSRVTYLSDARLTYYGHKNPWLLQAREGKLGPNRIHLTLIGNVRAQTLDTLNPVHIFSPVMQVQLQSETITSSDRVLILQQHNTLHGMGMIARLKAGTIELLSRVSGHYAL